MIDWIGLDVLFSFLIVSRSTCNFFLICCFINQIRSKGSMTDLNYIGYVLTCGDVYFKKYHLLLMNKANHQLGITMNSLVPAS